MRQPLHSIPSSRRTRILRRVYTHTNLRERVQNAEDLQHYVQVCLTWSTLPSNFLYAEAAWWCASFSGSGRWRITILQISMVRETHVVNQTLCALLLKKRCWRPLTPWLKMMLSHVREIMIVEDIRKWLPQSQPLSFSPIYSFSALSNPNGSIVVMLMFRRTAYELLAAKGYHEGFILMFLVSTLRKPFDEGKKTLGWITGRDVGLCDWPESLGKCIHGWIWLLGRFQESIPRAD